MKINDLIVFLVMLLIGICFVIYPKIILLYDFRKMRYSLGNLSEEDAKIRIAIIKIGGYIFMIMSIIVLCVRIFKLPIFP